MTWSEWRMRQARRHKPSRLGVLFGAISRFNAVADARRDARKFDEAKRATDAYHEAKDAYEAVRRLLAASREAHSILFQRRDSLTDEERLTLGRLSDAIGYLDD